MRLPKMYQEIQKRSLRMLYIVLKKVSLKDSFHVIVCFHDAGIEVFLDVGFFKMPGVIFDNFLYQHFGNTGDCNVSYLNKSIRDLKRNGFEIVKGEKVTTFIYTVIARKK